MGSTCGGSEESRECSWPPGWSWAPVTAGRAHPEGRNCAETLCHGSAPQADRALGQGAVPQQHQLPCETATGRAEPRAEPARGHSGQGRPWDAPPALPWPPAQPRARRCQEHPVLQAPAIESMTADKNNSRNSSAAWQGPSSQCHPPAASRAQGQCLHSEGSYQLSRAPPEPGAVLCQHPEQVGAGGQGQQGWGMGEVVVTGGLPAGGAARSTQGSPQLPTIGAAQALHSPENTGHRQDTLSQQPDSASGGLGVGEWGQSCLVPQG